MGRPYRTTSACGANCVQLADLSRPRAARYDDLHPLDAESPLKPRPAGVPGAPPASWAAWSASRRGDSALCTQPRKTLPRLSVGAEPAVATITAITCTEPGCVAPLG